MVAGLKSGGASPPPQILNPPPGGSFPRGGKFFACPQSTATGGMALNSAWVRGAIRLSPSSFSAA
mgnify:CR=1 FL=1